MTATKTGIGAFARSFGGVGSVGLLTYVGEYASFIVILAFLSDKLYALDGEFGYLFVGTISGVYLVASGLVAVPLGHLCDKYGRRLFAIIGCLLGVLGLVSMIVANGLTNLTQFSVVTGIGLCGLGLGHGTYTASTLAYTGDLAEKYKGMGKPYGLIEGAEFAGYAFGPALGTTIADIYRNDISVFEVSAAMLVVSAVIAFLLMPEIRGPAHASPGIVAAGLTAPDLDVSSGRADDDHDNGHDHDHSASWRDYVAAFKIPIISVALMTTFVGSIGFSGFFYYVPLYANSLRDAIPTLGLLYGYFGSIMALTAVILMVPIGHIEDKGGRRMPYLVIGLIAGALSLAFVFFTPNVPSFFIASLGFGASIAVVRVSQLVILAERSNTANRAAIMGTNHAVEHAGYGTATFVVGTFVAFFGFDGAFRVLSLILLVAGVAFLFYALKKKIR